MIRIQQLKLPAGQKTEALEKKIIKMLRIREDELLSYEIKKHSLDARKKPELYDVYTVDVQIKNEQQTIRKIKNKNIIGKTKEPVYSCTPCGTKELSERPIIIGTGPAGLFCGYELARMGYRPILLERGKDVDSRAKDVEKFWEEGVLLPESNVQFGEGGAGTFSDGKLNTLTHDREGRNKEVLRLFAAHGAPESILYENKPHIGTDILMRVVKNIRTSIIELGGDVYFCKKVTDIHTVTECGTERLCGLTVCDTQTNAEEYFETKLAVLAVGHSARDTFFMLHRHGVAMKPKAFAVGVRVEHPQALINASQYGRDWKRELPAAAYKLTANLENGRSVYTFCMCPGGFVVNASSEEGRLAVNGMSFSKRDGENANSAVIVTVSPEDYQSYCADADNALSGIKFQRDLEERAYQAGNGCVPVQLFGDFCKNQPSKAPGSIRPQIKGRYTWADVRGIFPKALADALEAGITEFDKRIRGYASYDAVLSGVESRTSSPVRITRDDFMESSIKGLYPCGEGAGYAGGITSAATDGLKAAETVSRIYRPFDTPNQD